MIGTLMVEIYFLSHIGTTKETKKQPHQVRVEPSASSTCPPQFFVFHWIHTYGSRAQDTVKQTTKMLSITKFNMKKSKQNIHDNCILRTSFSTIQSQYLQTKKNVHYTKYFRQRPFS